jgi:hypothetical protein
VKRLKDPAEPVAFLNQRSAGLGDKLRAAAATKCRPAMKMETRAAGGLSEGAAQGVSRTPSSSATRAGTSRRSSTCSGEHDASLVLSTTSHAARAWEATAGWVYLRGHWPAAATGATIPRTLVD